MRYDLYEWQKAEESPLDENLFFLIKTKDQVVEAIPASRKKEGLTINYWEYYPIALEGEITDVLYVAPPPPDPAFGEEYWNAYAKPLRTPGQTFLIFHPEWMRWVGAVYTLDVQHGIVSPFWTLKNIGEDLTLEIDEVQYWTVLPAAAGQYERGQWLQSLQKKEALPWG